MEQSSLVYPIGSWGNNLYSVNNDIETKLKDGWHVVSMVSLGDTQNGQVLVVYQKNIKEKI